MGQNYARAVTVSSKRGREVNDGECRRTDGPLLTRINIQIFHLFSYRKSFFYHESKVALNVSASPLLPIGVSSTSLKSRKFVSNKRGF